MKLRNSVGGNAPFEGDLIFRWQTIPANAKIVKATATVTPIDSKLGGPFTELLRFTNGTGDFGATKATGTTVDRSWVEVDFHSRRTLAGMTGSFGNLADAGGGCELQVDVGGGTYVELNQNGAFRTPSDPATSLFRVGGTATDLPGLTVAKLKATTKGAGAPPSLNTLRVRSVPMQVSLRVGELPPFWTHVGEMTLAETTADFAAVLQTVLTTAQVENGFYDLPLTVHSDSIARLKIDLEIEILIRQEVLPEAVPEIVLPFDSSTLSKSRGAELSIQVPLNSRVVPAETSARVRGSFTETRVAFGPTGPDNPTAAIEVSPAYSQAQIFEVGPKVSATSADREISAVAVDLLLESLTPSARLQLDIRGDFDGKPDEIPLLPSPVEFAIEQRPEKGGTWTMVQLPSEFLFAKAKDKPSRYWFLLQCLEGRAAWSVVEISKDSRATTPPDKLVNAQRTTDGGLSWQDTSLMATSLRDILPTPPYIALLRLRDKPKTFKMPIKLQIGTGTNVVNKSLERFEPLGRVDFTLDTELAQGINDYLAQSAAPVHETEHLLNPDFEQWSRVGREPNPQPVTSLSVSPRAVAFSPDGAVAYVLAQNGQLVPFLLIVDAGCNQEKRGTFIPLSPLSAANAFVISPDGTRAYVSSGLSLRVVDLVANQTVGELFNLGLDGGEQIGTGLAISADGQFLYTAHLRAGGEGPAARNLNRIRAINTAKLEQHLTTGIAPDEVVKIHDVPTDSLQPHPPSALALSPDGLVLYLVIDFDTVGPSVVRQISTSTFSSGGDLRVGLRPSAIAISPNGRVGVVTNTGSNNVSIFDTASRSVTTVPVDSSPVGVVISPDSARSYVLINQTDRLISTIDLGQKSVVNKFAFRSTRTVTAFALAPAEEKIYVVMTQGQTSSLLPIEMGTRLPAEWQVTSGVVSPMCLPTPFHRVAVMNSESSPTSFSQVVPVAESLVYEFSFWGIAVEPRENEPPALAEVLWLNGACGLLKVDPIPIELIERGVEETPVETFGRFGVGSELMSRLVLHRATLESPAGANQAEVRFSVGKTAIAAIDLVSLTATSELAANGDFQLRKNNQLIGWNLVPAQTPGFRAEATPEAIQFSNHGSVQVELVQTIAVESEQPFTLQFEGNATATLPSETPRIELRWLDAGGAAIGEPTLLKILPTGVDTASANGVAPQDSVQAEIHVVVPPKTSLEVKRVSLKYTKTTPVSVKFISEAPGDMIVSDVRIAFEQVEPKAPSLGRQNLCSATPPGDEPGERVDSCYCHQCEEETLMMQATAVLTESGRPATKGRCSTCKTEVVRAGGAMVVGGEALSPPSIPAQPVMVSPSSLTSLIPESQVVGPAPQLTDIRGIGEARARQLTAIGIDSVEKLAESTPEQVAEIQFITKTLAAQIIEQAKSSLT
jgi:DNA-binding beta-propeller fold protein YncE